MLTYAATTRDIQIAVRAIYLDEPSDLLDHHFRFGYVVQVMNAGDDEVQLLRRRWTIRESNGRLQDEEGDVDLRARPVLAPGETHAFDGSCTLSSFDGVVEGNYLVQRSNGERFRAALPSFHLHAAAN
jgi:ApaG protein